MDDLGSRGDGRFMSKALAPCRGSREGRRGFNAIKIKRDDPWCGRSTRDARLDDGMDRSDRA
jgi:hypothetical protein